MRKQNLGLRGNRTWDYEETERGTTRKRTNGLRGNISRDYQETLQAITKKANERTHIGNVPPLVDSDGILYVSTSNRSRKDRNNSKNGQIKSSKGFLLDSSWYVSQIYNPRDETRAPPHRFSGHFAGHSK